MPAAREQAVRTGQARTFEIRSLTLDFGVNYYRNELAWLQNAIERVRELPEPGESSRAE